MAESIQSFEKYVQEFKQYKQRDLSETDTRSKVLDVILLDVLNWKEHDITREGYVGNGFFDYLIEVPGFKFVVEAKKLSVDFKLPTTGREHSLGLLYSGNSEVIDQIRNYAFKKDVGFGVISNGHQFIISRFINTDGSNWKKIRQ